MPITSEILKQFTYNRIFVETGTGLGAGVQAALEAGFEQIISMEFYKRTYARASAKFRNEPKVVLIEADSSVHLTSIIEHINEPTTFFLDAHFIRTPDTPKCEGNPCPVLQEIVQITHHPIKTHTILIDDRRLFQRGVAHWGNIREMDIYRELRRIGKYNLSFVDGEVENDIIVADFRSNHK